MAEGERGVVESGSAGSGFRERAHPRGSGAGPAPGGRSPASMGPPKSSQRRRFLAPSVLFLWIALPALTWAVDYARRSDNTFRIYRHVFWHLWERRNLYLPYPAQYGDVNLYGPLFGLVTAPFALLPEVLGGLAWNLAMAGLLAAGLLRVAASRERALVAMLLCTLELANANWANQFNPAVAALMLLTFASVERRREFLAPLFVLVGAYVKIYSGAGLLFLLFARDRRAFLAGTAFWGALLLALPMAIGGPGFVLASYRDWVLALAAKSAHNVRLDTAQDISVLGLVRRVAGRPIAGGWFYLVGVPLALAPFLRLRQYRHATFRVLTLASLLLFLVLFSSGSENSTYVVAAAGVALWMTEQERPFRPRNLVLLGGTVLIGLATTDLLGVPFRRFCNQYSLKALPYAVVWLFLLRDLLREDFAARTRARSGLRARNPAPLPLPAPSLDAAAARGRSAPGG